MTVNLNDIPYKMSISEISPSFKKRMPKTPYMTTQWKSLSKKNRDRVLYAVQKQLRKRVKIDPTLKDEDFYREVYCLKYHEEQPTTYGKDRAAQYDVRAEEKLVGRAEARAKRFQDLVKLIPDDLPVVKTVADIGAGDGVISKICTQALFPKATQLDIYEPYVDEFKLDMEFPFKVNFKKEVFKSGQKYDAVFLITALHHITNPDEIIQAIHESLNPDGLLLVREHQPWGDNDKMMINVIDVLWEVSFTKEKTVEEFKALQKDDKWINPPSAYFTSKELSEVLNGFKLLGQLKEVKYQFTELFQYFVFQKVDRGLHPAVGRI